MKNYKKVFLFLFLIAKNTWAGNPVNVVDASHENPNNQVNSQRNAAQAYGQCVHDAVYGVCPGSQSNECVGANPALQNAPKKSVCKRKILFFCLKWGHKQNTQQQWMDVANGHLSNARTCNHLKLDAASRGEDLDSFADDVELKSGSGSKKYSDLFNIDGKFIGDDGSSKYGLENGEIYNRFMDGEELKDIIASSPYAESLSEEDRKGLLEDDDYEGENTAAASYVNKGKDGSEALGNFVGLSPRTGASNLEQTKKALDRSLASSEKSIFEIVNDKYRDYEEDFLTTDYYINSYKAEYKNKYEAILQNRKTIK